MYEHAWLPTTSSRAVFQCSGCKKLAWMPGPLPRDGCEREETHDVVLLPDSTGGGS